MTNIRNVCSLIIQWILKICCLNQLNFLVKMRGYTRSTAKTFGYILVDEFQDTNKAQYELIKLLVSRNGKICVVGDDAQSIYSWRGANFKNILDFEKDFPKHKVFKLEQNYRSTKVILQAASSVINLIKIKLLKTLWTENNDGELLTLVRCADEKDEAFQIAKYIKKEVSKKKLSLNDFAVLYRTNAQSRALEDTFQKRKNPVHNFRRN